MYVKCFHVYAQQAYGTIVFVICKIHFTCIAYVGLHCTKVVNEQCDKITIHLNLALVKTKNVTKT